MFDDKQLVAPGVLSSFYMLQPQVFDNFPLSLALRSDTLSASRCSGC